MIDPTSSSMNQSPTEGDTPSKPNLPMPVVKGLNLSDIPHFSQSTTPTASKNPSISSMEPVSCEGWDQPTVEPSPDTNVEVVEGRFEYEFTNLWDGCLYSVYLSDTSDVSACERVLNRPVTAEELSYSDTGNGFVVDGEFKYTFHKSPYKRISASIPQPSYEAKMNRRQSIKVRTADDILAEL